MTDVSDAPATQKSISQRLPDKFKFVFTCGSDDALLQLSGPITNRDELDAITESLAIMRDWLPDAQPSPASTPTPESI